MRYLITIFIFSFLGVAAQAQQQSLATKALTPESTGAAKLKGGSTEVAANASPFIGDLPVRRTGSANASKPAVSEESEPGSWRMFAAAVLFMLVIALRRQGSGRP